MSEPRQSEDQIPRTCIRLGRCRTRAVEKR